MSVYTSKEIRAALNNAFMALKNQHDFNFDKLSNGRRQALRQYAGALISPVENDIENEYLSEQEVTFLLLAAAVFISKRYLNNRMPADDEAEMIFGKNEYAKLLPEMLCLKCACKLGENEGQLGRPSNRKQVIE